MYILFTTYVGMYDKLQIFGYLWTPDQPMCDLMLMMNDWAPAFASGYL